MSTVVPRELIRFYLRHLYPAPLLYRMLASGFRDDGDYRELALVSNQDRYWRDPERKLRSEPQFMRYLRAMGPAQLHLGQLRHASGTRTKEVVIDLDVTDFQRFCGCGKGACALCWLHIEGASLVLHHILTCQLGLRDANLLWVLSGRKGLHCLVNDARYVAFDDGQRARFAAFLSCQTWSRLKAFAAHLTRQTRQEWLAIFRARCVVARRLLEIDAFQTHVLDVLREHCPPLLDATRRAWRHAPDSEARWDALLQLEQQHFGGRSDVRPALLLMLRAFYPVVDGGPLRLGHLSKAPFSVHTSTGRVALPVERQAILDYALPEQQLTLADVCAHYRAASVDGHEDCVEPRFAAGALLLDTWLDAQ